MSRGFISQALPFFWHIVEKLAGDKVNTHHDWLPCVAALHMTVWFVVYNYVPIVGQYDIIIFMMEIASHCTRHLIFLFPSKGAVRLSVDCTLALGTGCAVYIHELYSEEVRKRHMHGQKC